ncbi:hypothetical protein GCK32_006303 [Trichostrongylus colubriformis]|uniref:Uncharacterized protein n=1 Tax=Trichostrongylus colubriformis TaxID=6319 RepID=A0AAN8FPJ8_TRICO
MVEGGTHGVHAVEHSPIGRQRQLIQATEVPHPVHSGAKLDPDTRRSRLQLPVGYAEQCISSDSARIDDTNAPTATEKVTRKDSVTPYDNDIARRAPVVILGGQPHD